MPLVGHVEGLRLSDGGAAEPSCFRYPVSWSPSAVTPTL